MSIDGRVNATLQFMQTEVRKLQSHSKACLQMVNWMLRCARRHSPLMGRVMHAHFKACFNVHRLRIERSDMLASKKYQELLCFIRKIVKLSGLVMEQTKRVMGSLDLIITENEARHGERHRARDGNALVRLRAENAALVAENMALLCEVTHLREQ